MNFYEWLGQPGGIIGPAIGDASLYANKKLQPFEYVDLLNKAIDNLAYASDANARKELITRLHQAGGFPGESLEAVVKYWGDPARPLAELRGMTATVGGRLAQMTAAKQLPGTAGTASGIVDPRKGVTDTPPVDVNGTKIPQGGRVVIVNNPKGSDEKKLYYIIYEWRGVEFAFQVGGAARFNELFGSTNPFAQVNTVSQAAYDQAGYVGAGLIDSEIGSTESFGSKLERETRELGLEDLPSWLAGAPDALALVATAAAEEWSSGRLWQALSGTQAFKTRFGTAWQRYMQQGRTIAEAVQDMVADENELREAIRPFFAGTTADNTQFLQQLLNQGWTGSAAAQVLEQAEVLRRDPESLTLSNFILEASGIATLDEVGFLNALNGVGPQDVIEALNTATAARALDESGIDLADEDLNLIMDLVDTSDRLLTVESWRALGQELALNVMRFGTELDQGKLGIEREDLIAAAFGQEAPSGKSSGEVMGLLARFERDRRAASQGVGGVTAFMNEEGRLQVQGLGGL